VPAGAPTILVQGNSTYNRATLTAAGSFTNAGTITLQANYGYPSDLTVTSGTLTNAASGVINVNPDGGGGSRTITADLVNNGTINVKTATALSTANGTYTNAGTLNIASGASLSVSGSGQTFRQGSGTLNNSGAFGLSGNATFDFAGGTLAGNAPVVSGASLKMEGAAAGTILVAGSTTLLGDVPAGAPTIVVQGSSSAGNATLTAASSFTNAGTITLQANYGYASDLAVSSGTLTNAGTINVNPDGGGGSRTIAADLVNDGTINVNTATTLSAANGTHTNAGALNIASGASLSVSGVGQTFRQSGGALNNSGTFGVSGGATFDFAGGRLVGNAPIVNATALKVEAAAAGTILVWGNSTLVGNLPAGAPTIVVQGNSSVGNATLNLANGAVNTDTIDLTDSNGYTAQLTSSGTYTNAGTIEAQLGTGGSRYLNGTVANQGLIGIASGTTVTIGGGPLTNAPNALITGGGTLNTSGVTFVNNGTVDLSLPSVLDEEIQPSTLQITYVSTNGMNASTVTNPANYTIIGSGGNEDGLISGITYNSATGVATISFSKDVPPDLYQVTINGNAVKDASGNALNPGGPVVVNRVLAIVPATASVSIDPGSDSGAPDHPGYTNVAAPTFDVQVNQGGSITVDFDGNAAHDQTRSVPVAGTYQFTAPTLANGAFTATATFTSKTGGTAQDATLYTIDTAHPHVTAFSPTGTINTSAAQATVTFSEPVDLSTLTPSAITLTGPAGVIAVNQPQLVSGSTYTIGFATQAALGTYTLTIAPTVTNFAGNKIDQKQDGTNAGFTGSFTIALPDLQVTNLALVGPANPQSGNQVTVNWDDANMGTSATTGSWTDAVTVVNTTTGATLVNAAGVPYNGANLAANGSALQSYAFTLPDGTAGVGKIQVTVTANANHALVESDFTNNTASTSFTSTLAPYPDLQVTGLAVSPASAAGGLQSGAGVKVSWNDSNTGDGPVHGAFTDAVLVQHVNGDGSLTTLASGSVAGNSTLAPGASSPQQFNFTLPNGTAGTGTFQVTVTTNAGNTVFEFNMAGPGGSNTASSNNTATTTFTSTLAAYPDLAASGVTAPATVAPGQQITVGWTLANNGNAAANGPWTEQVLLATDAKGGGATLLQAFRYAGPLAAGQSVSRSVTVQVPNVGAGNYWLVVSENPFAEVYETNTANNTAVASQSTAVEGTLTLALASHSVSDAAGASATTATVSRNTDTSAALVVTLASSIPASVSVPQTVTIPAGQASVTFPVGTIDRGIVVGTQAATLTASATGAVSGSDTLTVTDVNVPTLTLALASHSIGEAAANPATIGTVTRNTSTASALVVSLVSNSIDKLTVPASVTIPAGQASVTFPVTVVNDGQIDGNTTVTVNATSAGFVTGADSAVVVDPNVPTLSLALADHTVSEAAQDPATTGTVSIASAASQPITIALASSDTTAATVPVRVVIGAGQESASFPIAAVDDGLDRGDKPAIITAKVETNAGVILDQGAATDTLLLGEADGPALTVGIGVSAVNKGTQAPATVTRNTSTTDPLVVSLASSDPTKATVPATVTIAAGQTSASFMVAAIDDHTPDGLQHVQVSASATGFDTGIAPLGITDVDLPDLVVAGVTAPAGGYDNASASISWTVTNSGKYPAAGSWLDQVYLDPVGGPPSTTPADTVPFTGTVNAGQSYNQSDTLPLPATVGQYTVRVVTDANQTVQELSFSNNTGTSTQPVNDQASYQATVSTTVTTVPNGTPVPLSGVATLTGTGAPAANVPVAVGVLVNGTTRTLTAYTDSGGHYSITFEPLQTEAGAYAVTAADPGVTNPAVQAHFEIVGMTASPASGNVQVVPNTPLSGQFTLTNLSGVPLTGVTATASGGPAGLTEQLTPPSQVAGNGTATLGYSLDATSAKAASGVVTIQLTSAEGAVLNILVGVSILPLAPNLAANPGFLNTGMLVGAQSTVSFTVVNNGGAPSGDLQVSLPGTPYLSLASPATIPSLATGASSTVTLELSPPSNLPLEQYTGTIGVSNTQTGISVPFTFTAITNAVGTVHVLVDDDYRFDKAGSPRVQGATVNLLNPYDNTQVAATGPTDATGAVTLSNVPAGPYVLQVEATGHSSYENSYTVVPGITNNDEVFIQRQFVSYTWVVAQTTIQDTYQIKLQTTFETNVPAPVVTISAPSSIPTLAPGQSGTFNVTVTNHGLIAAQGVTLQLPTDPEYTFTALGNPIGVLPAQTSVVVPITVTRSAPQAVSNSEGGTTLTTKVEAANPIGQTTSSVLYVDYTNSGSVAIPAPLLELTAMQNGNPGAFLSLDPALAGLGYTSNSTPAGFNDTVQFLASGATPGMLAPGERVSIPVYYGGWLASGWTPEDPVTFSLSELGTSSIPVYYGGWLASGWLSLSCKTPGAGGSSPTSPASSSRNAWRRSATSKRAPGSEAPASAAR
jgi:hypothetical protein